MNGRYNPLKKNEKKNKNINENKNESALVTKESFSAAFMLFSFLAAFMLCTGSAIFGEVGVGIQSFLLGMFGYFAYPLFFGATYLFFMMLIEKKLVKNRKAGFALGLAIVCAALIIHTATTYSWDLEGYAEKCFFAGESFSTATVTGLMGGLLISALASLLSQTGVIIAFSVLCALFVYLFIVFLGKKQEKQPKNRNIFKKEKATLQQEVASANGEQQPSAPINESTNKQGYTRVYQGQPQNNLGDMRYTQRPGVRLTEDDTLHTSNDTYGFSPFGPKTQDTKNDRSLERSYENAREFLFGTGATESYKQNLIFDPNANVNNLPPVEPIVGQPISNSDYIPSYTAAYQDSLNEQGTESRPKKIIADYYGSAERTEAPFEESNSSVNAFEEDIKPQNTEEQSFERETYLDYGREEPTVTAMEDLKPLAEVAPQEAPVPYETIRSEFLETKEETLTPPTTERSFVRDSFADTTDTEPQTEEDTPYRRHNYMDLFAVDNPRELKHDDLFGNRDSVEEARAKQPKEEESPRGRGERDGLHLFDDETEENPYVLRSDFEEPRGFNEVPLTDSRSRGETSSRGFGREDISLDRGRVFDSAPADLPPPIVKEEPKKVESPKPTPPPKPRIPKPYVRMSLDDLDCRDVEPTQNHEEVENAKATIIATLEEFKVSGATIASVTFGPTVTRYNVTLPRGIMPAKVVALDQSISMNLYSKSEAKRS